VQAVAPFVQEDRGDLAGVRATGTGPEEVQRAAVPVRVADLVEVHVRGHLRLQPGIRRQDRTRLLVDPGQVVEAGARGVRVAGTAEARRRAVGAAAGAEREVAVAARGQRDRTAGIAHAEVLAVQGRRRGAAGVVVDAERIGDLGAVV